MGFYSLLLWGILLFQPFSFAMKRVCRELLTVADSTSQSTVRVESLLRSSATPDEVKVALRSYRQANSAFKEMFPEDAVAAALADPSLPIYGRNLGEILTLVRNDSTQRSPEAKIRAAIRRYLRNKVPLSSIAERIRRLEDGESDGVLRALGDNTVAEMSELFYGTNLKHPSSDSLVGQYLADTGAKIDVVKLENGPGTRRYGAERLLVALSEETFPAFTNYFAREEFLSIVGHALLIHNGTVKGIGFSDLRLPHMGMVLPFLVLKTTEGQRVTQYLGLFRSLGAGWNHVAAQPWLLPGYCAVGGYSCCTHWIGNIPMGDRLVDTYSFPGRWENNQEPPRSAPLQPYVHDNPLVKRVWTVPGHEQLADAIGLRESNLRGWIAYTLMGRASVERVPVVFQVVENHRRRIPNEFITAQ